jgi:hypothetical protein
MGGADDDEGAVVDGQLRVRPVMSCRNFRFWIF